MAATISPQQRSAEGPRLYPHDVVTAVSMDGWPNIVVDED